MNSRRQLALLVAVSLACIAAQARAQAAKAEEPAQFYKAAYLQAEERNFAAAAELFAEVAKQDDAPREIRTAARRRLAECREEIAAADLASLMPPDSIVYLQLANVGPQAARLLEVLGIARYAQESADRIPIEPGLSIPTNLALSPALVREIAKLGGVAAAMNGLDERGIPKGVVVVHLGGSDLVRGLVETGIQIVTPADKIGDYVTYRIPAEGENLWLVKTERLLVFSNSRDEVAAAVSRLDSDAGAPSLKNSDSFASAAAARGESLLFAWADSQRAAPLVDELMRHEMQPQEMMVARTVLNLQQIESATFSLGATDNGARAEASVRFMPGHEHLLYGLVRTAPIGEDALGHVPASAGAVVAIGLNPPIEAASEGEQGVPQLALMDIGRELFANVRSVTGFVVPGETELPEIGVVITAQNGAKSKQLWTRLLALPAQFGAAPPEAVKELEIHGHAATQYAYPGAPPVFVTQPSDDSLIVGTATAVEASLAALEEAEAFGAEHAGAKLVERMEPGTSKAVFLRAGQLVRCAQPSMGEHERREMAAIAPLLEDLTASLTVDEDPNELRIRIEAAGVPKVSEVLRAVSGQIRSQQTRGELQAAAAPQ